MNIRLESFRSCFTDDRCPFGCADHPVFKSAAELCLVKEGKSLEGALESRRLEIVRIDADSVHADGLNGECDGVGCRPVENPQFQYAGFSRFSGLYSVWHPVGAAESPGQFRALGETRAGHLSAWNDIPVYISDS